jgi:hypothetical protein
MRSSILAVLLFTFLASILSCKKAVDPTLEAYRIYSAFFAYQTLGHGDDALRPDAGYTAILADIPATPMTSLVDLSSELQGRLPEIEPGTIAAEVNCSKTGHKLDARFALPVPYAIAYDTKAPQRLGYLQLSCVGINPAGTQAVFHVDRVKCGTCGIGKWILMRKSNDGEWHIQKEDIEWIV